MKHLMKLENFTQRKKNKYLNIGDYVICTDFSFLPKEELEFLENSIGRIVEIELTDKAGRRNENPYCVSFENAPLGYFMTFNNEFPGCRWFNLKEIKHYSSNREKLEPIILAKKFNL